MPCEYGFQQIGLILTKAFAFHIRNASRKMGINPRGTNCYTPEPPPGFDPLPERDVTPMDHLSDTTGDETHSVSSAVISIDPDDASTVGRHYQ
mmetsp:Transcript_8078/g.14150  ORF Transcript_8078/g.14150 Transcript_8078/m.14150 type:complete len:93 (-) Transcript_8078:34-312(-)